MLRLPELADASYGDKSHLKLPSHRESQTPTRSDDTAVGTKGSHSQTGHFQAIQASHLPLPRSFQTSSDDKHQNYR